tara:strand:+ start:45310 stop:46230 length:921 start_codon:yes stop_codon:yes gene_type:complete
MIMYRFFGRKHFKFLISFYFILFTQIILSQSNINSDNDFTVYKNLQFSESDQQLTLDLYVPNHVKNPIPCIITIQGGGFLSQNGQKFRYFAEYIAKNNYAAALISYRGRPDYEYKTTIQDVKSAVRYIRRESQKYLINPDKIGATGKSAGATLSALLAVTGNNSIFDEKDNYISSTIQAAVVYAGVFDFITRFTDSTQIVLQPKINIKIATNGEWIGTPFSKDDKHWKMASATEHLDKNASPILFMHCKDDETVPWLQSQNMYERMKNLGIITDTLYFKEGDHGFNMENKELYLDPMISFFKKRFE